MDKSGSKKSSKKVRIEKDDYFVVERSPVNFGKTQLEYLNNSRLLSNMFILGQNERNRGVKLLRVKDHGRKVSPPPLKFMLLNQNKPKEIVTEFSNNIRPKSSNQ